MISNDNSNIPILVLSSTVDSIFGHVLCNAYYCICFDPAGATEGYGVLWGRQGGGRTGKRNGAYCKKKEIRVAVCSEIDNYLMLHRFLKIDTTEDRQKRS